MSSLLTADESAFERLFPEQPFRIRHALAGDPRLTLPAILDLVRALPGDRIEYNSGKASVSQDPDATPLVDLPPEEVIRQIETAGAWMVLKRVESHPAYMQLLRDALMSVARAQGHASLEDAGFFDLRGFLFVSSPRSITPFHIDSEANFFVQIHGEKFFNLYDNRDRSIASEEQIEGTIAKHRNLKFDPAYDAKGVRHHLDPGEGLFVPYQWPHWVETVDTYSISLALTWKTRDVLRRNDLITMNSMLRDRGLPQRAPGLSPLADAAKIAAFRLAKGVTAPLRRSERLRAFVRRLALGRDGNYFYRKNA
jgi:hypothetical protein